MNRDGTFSLLAVNCGIYGDMLIFEPEYKNLGYWQRDTRSCRMVGGGGASRDLRCLAQIGRRIARSPWRILFGSRAEAQRWCGRSSSRAQWDAYRRVKLGTIALAAGEK